MLCINLGKLTTLWCVKYRNKRFRHMTSKIAKKGFTCCCNITPVCYTSPYYLFHVRKNLINVFDITMHVMILQANFQSAVLNLSSLRIRKVGTRESFFEMQDSICERVKREGEMVKRSGLYCPKEHLLIISWF